jgi:hypothetical protein
MRFIVGLHRFLGFSFKDGRAPTAERFCASFGLTLDVTSLGRRQARGGRKGGLPACEENGLPANDAVIFAKAEGNTMTADVPRKKLKHLSTHVAMAAQTSVAFSQGLALGGQQSGMSSVAEVTAVSRDLALTPALPAAGKIATDRAIRSTTMVRAMLMAGLARK